MRNEKQNPLGGFYETRVKMNRQGILVSCVLLALCGGCATSTITPDPIVSHEASYDATTPKQYPNAWNSGLLFQTTDARGQFDGVVITEGGRDFYVFLVRSYSIQYKSEHGLDLTGENGVRPFKDEFGNPLWWIDNQRFAAMQIMSTWLKCRRDPDSLWQRAKERITPL